MCGFTGLFGAQRWSGAQPPSEIVRAMTAAITHRGPDAEGYWAAESSAIVLGHRRLSIIDLTETGAQPMVSHDGRYVIAFNGEIYNFPAIRADLEARHGTIAWRGHSDTEVLLEACARDGIDALLDCIDGMFTFALFDRKTRELTLARDAFGEKPLYYGLHQGALVFGSELHSFREIPGFQPSLDLDSLGGYFKYSYVPGPATIWKGFYKLAPGHRLTVSETSLAQSDLPQPAAWWDMTGDALRSSNARFEGSHAEALEHADALLSAGVARRMIADVPMGSLLSGGIDSSIVTAMMCEHSGEKVRTFSIGMDSPGYDESPAAKAVAEHLGTDHQELVLSPAEVQDVIPTIAAKYDEPFADSSQVPTFLVSRMARQQVKAVLSGDGGDEIFGGYNRYFQAPRIWNKVGRLPLSARKALAGTLQVMPMEAIERMAKFAGPLAPKELSAGRLKEKSQKLARVLAQPNEAAFHDSLLATAADPAGLLSFDAKATQLTSRLDGRAAELSFAERAMLIDTANYLHDDVLTKVDRASMAVSLETRTPFLDRDLFRFAWSLPQELRTGSAEGKPLLRDMLYRRLPRELVDRPKAGFAIPVGRWLRSGLRDWAESELSESALSKSGLLNAKAIRERWAEHLSGKRDHETLLWNVLMFQGWMKQ